MCDKIGKGETPALAAGQEDSCYRAGGERIKRTWNCKQNINPRKSCFVNKEINFPGKTFCAAARGRNGGLGSFLITY